MSEPTKQELMARIAELERKLAGHDAPERDWRSVVGIFGDSELAEQVAREVLAAREAERDAARRQWELEDAKAAEEAAVQ